MLNFENVRRIAYLGPQSSFCEMATDHFCEKFKINAYPEICETIGEVTDFIDKNHDTLGVLPVENSVEGTVKETLDRLMQTQNPNIRILSEHYRPANLCLLSRTTEIYSISGIISTPEALGKCKNFIKNEMPFNVNIIESASIPESARLLQGYNLTYSSIGTPKTAEIFNLNILKDNINDNKTNQTRFVLLGDFETEETGSDKTSVAFSTKNKPGALLGILNIFMKNNINLSYIASNPSNNKFGEYIITISFDGHIHNPHILKTLRDIKENVTYLRFLGSYKKKKPILLQ
jgi:prephenate dehydratase